MEIRKATINDCKSIAELALMAGDGITAYFWEQFNKENQEIIDVGANNLMSETENFSYRNVTIAEIDSNVVGMLLAYKLPSSSYDENLNDYPEFFRPMIELELCVPNSYYLNMLATYPNFRGKSVGLNLLSTVSASAINAGCELVSIEVFEQNLEALRLYQRLGYKIVEKRKIKPHSCHPYTGGILLLTKNMAIINYQK